MSSGELALEKKYALHFVREIQPYCYAYSLSEYLNKFCFVCGDDISNDQGALWGLE